MTSESHRLVTTRAFDILKSIYETLSLNQSKDIVVEEASNTDYKTDLEFVDVDYGRDDPHEEKASDDDDEPHYEEDGSYFTTFNHCIDIKKGAGIFDDYDGYSYEKGSASVDEYQNATEVTSNVFATILSWLMDYEVDEAINLWFDDEYVHAPGHPWYRNCSPCLEKYSFIHDLGKYNSVVEELKARFPLTSYGGAENEGIPYSVFLPVDNIARYWFGMFKITRKPECLGYVLHAIQDASIPHHAAGYMGNWHGEYESVLGTDIKKWWKYGTIQNIKELVEQWDRIDKNPPRHLNVDDWNKTPAKNWRIDHLVTWVALHAYKEYRTTYRHFKNGFYWTENSVSSAKKLTRIATAMSTLVLIKASETSLSLLEALSNVAIYPPFNVPGGFVPYPETKSLRKMMEAMYLGRFPK